MKTLEEVKAIAWIPVNETISRTGEGFKCPKCGYIEIGKPKYCSNCGTILAEEKTCVTCKHWRTRLNEEPCLSCDDFGKWCRG